MQTTFVCLIKYSHYQFCLIWFISHTSPGTQPIRLTNLWYHLSYQPAVVSHGMLYPHTHCSPKSLLGKILPNPRNQHCLPGHEGFYLWGKTEKASIVLGVCPGHLCNDFFNLRSFSAAASWLQQGVICVLHRHTPSHSPQMPAALPAQLFSRSLILTGGNTSVPITPWNNP